MGNRRCLNLADLARTCFRGDPRMLRCWFSASCIDSADYIWKSGCDVFCASQRCDERRGFVFWYKL